jgi:hypothetical protein
MRLAWPIALLLLTTVAPARADVTVDIQPGSGTDFATALGVSEQELEDLLRTELEALFNVIRPDDYAQQMADAQAFSTKGIGVDYAGEVENFVFGVAANLSVALDANTISDDSSSRPVGGIAPQLTIMAGLNLHFMGLKPVTIYGNFFTRSFSYRDFDATLRNAGFHAQINLFRPKPAKANAAFRWAGFDLTTGIEWSQFKLSLDAGLDTDFDITGDNGSATIALASTGEYTYSSSAFSVPIELTTAVRILTVLSLYLGVGTDFQVGSSDFEIDLDAELTGTRPDNGEEVDLGDASITATAEGKPSTAKFRALLGAQVNIWKLRLFAQLNYRPVGTAGVTAGLRIAF